MMEEFKRHIKLSLELSAWSSLGLVGIVTLFVPRRFISNDVEILTPNIALNESIILMNSTLETRVQDYLTKHFFWDISNLPIFIISLLLYLRLGTRAKVALLMSFLSGCILFTIIRIYLGVESLAAQASLFAPFLFTAACLKLCILPRDSWVTSQFLLQSVIYGFGMVVVGLFSAIDFKDGFNKVLSICVVIPAFREISYTVVRAAAKNLCLEPGIGGTGVQVRREVSWGFFLWVQTTMSLLVRTFYARVDSPGTMVFVICYQSLIEIVSRVTLPWRTRKFHRISKDLSTSVSRTKSFGSRSQRRSTLKPMQSHALIMPSTVSNAAEGPSKKSRSMRAIDAYVSMLIIGEMLSEFFAILAAPALVLLFEDARLVMPFMFFSELEEPLTTRIDHMALLFWTLSQLVSEILVDCLCSIWEARNGYDHWGVWLARNKRKFALIFVAAACNGVGNLLILVNSRDAFGPECLGRNMCYCAGDNGLTVSGLREQYCIRLFPPSGVPPS